MNISGEDVKVEVDSIRGKEPKYGAWSIDVKCWVETDDGREHERVIRKNIPKERNPLEEDDNGVPKFIYGFKDTYMDRVEEEHAPTSTGVDRADECEGCQYDP